MSEYVHRLPRGNPSGVAQDPDQTVGNATDSLVNQPLTAKNAVVIGASVAYGKRIVSAGFNATFNQIGSARLERQMNVASKGIGYIGLGLVSGGVLLPLLSFAADTGTKVIQGLEEQQKITFDNERKLSERGGITSIGNSYD